ncbi:MAG: hypothetical protein ACE5K0_09395 [Candidatus Methanofastidiosia archaeon]
MGTKLKNQPQLEIKAITTERNNLSFLLWNYPICSYFLDRIKLKWWFKNSNGSEYSNTRLINRWIEKSGYEFRISYFELEPKDLLWDKVKRGKDLRDIMRLEVVVYYQDRENKTRIVSQQVL